MILQPGGGFKRRFRVSNLIDYVTAATIDPADVGNVHTETPRTVPIRPRRFCHCEQCMDAKRHIVSLIDKDIDGDAVTRDERKLWDRYS